MKVLAIGNSFSNDAMRYLHEISGRQEEIKAVNLYIGGCSLFQHYVNMNNDALEYDFEYNGERTGIKVSIRQALQSDLWDVVTLQQVSSQSENYDTYQPYLGALAEYVKMHAPKAKIMLHQTWAYEEGSALCREAGYEHHEDMLADVRRCYARAAEELGGVELIPSGEAVYELTQTGAGEVYRDTFHMNLGMGRYMLGLVWFEMLTGKQPDVSSFTAFDTEVTMEQKLAAERCAHLAVERMRNNV